MNPNDRQSDQQAAELVDTITRIHRRIPELERQAKEMGRGYPSGAGQGGGGGDCGDECECRSSPERLTLHIQSDPALQANAAVEEYKTLRRTLADMLRSARQLDGRTARLMPSPLEPGRSNDVPLCELCAEPAPDKVKRIDGQPYHERCYFKVWRSGRAS